MWCWHADKAHSKSWKVQYNENLKILIGTTVENKGKLILTENFKQNKNLNILNIIKT